MYLKASNQTQNSHTKISYYYKIVLKYIKEAYF